MQLLKKMSDYFSWQYDEFKQVGTDYGSKAEVESYDLRHSDFRDMDAESMYILDSLEIKRRDVIIDFAPTPALLPFKRLYIAPECMPLMFHKL